MKLGLFMLDRGCWTFFVKCKIINILGFVPLIVSVATTQLCHCSMRASMGNM